jgi:hypothetical protein
VLSSTPITTAPHDQPPLWMLAVGLAGGGLLAVTGAGVLAFAFYRKRTRGMPSAPTEQMGQAADAVVGPSPPDPNVRPS